MSPYDMTGGVQSLASACWSSVLHPNISMTEPAVDVSPQSFVREMLLATRFGRLTCEVRPTSLSTELSRRKRWCSVRLSVFNPPRSSHGWVSGTSLAVTLHFLFLLCDNHLSHSVFTVFRFLPDSHLPLPRLLSILSSITWGLYFLERRQKEDGREWIQRWPRFSAHLSCSFLSSRRTSKGQGRGRGLQAAWWTSENLDPVWNWARVMWRDWNLAEGRAWWDFSAAVAHTLHTWRVGCVAAMTLKVEVKTSLGAKWGYFITKKNIKCFNSSENICSLQASSWD